MTVYTGKVEVGQGSRTSLTQVVAEELRVDPGRIALVMGDTAKDATRQGHVRQPDHTGDVTPATQSRRIGDSLLLGLAAERWSIDREQLTSTLGAITNAATGQSLTYGELTNGRELASVVEDAVELTAPEQWRVTGSSLPKVEGRSFVTGRHQYPSDIKRPGMRYGKILRPPSVGAKLESIDTARAEKVSGVTVVHDGEFVGVVAPDEPTAMRALRLIQAAGCRIPRCVPIETCLPTSVRMSDRAAGPSCAGEGLDRRRSDTFGRVVGTNL